jgi:hypothetical protein
MNLKSRAGAVAAGLALAVGAGVTYAAPALATNEIQMCLFVQGTTTCAVALPQSGADVGIGGYPVGGSPWDAPTANTGQISYWDVSPQICWEVDASAGNIIHLASCAGKVSEEWTPIKTSVTVGTSKQTAYYYESDYDPSRCLSMPASLTGTVVTATCNFGNDAKQRWIFGHGG